MKRIRNLAVAGCTVLLLSQCASQDEVRDLNYQIRAVNQKVDEVRSTTVDQMQKRQASSGSRLDSLQSDVMQLQSKMEEQDHQEQLSGEQEKESIAGLRAMITQSLAENERRLKLTEEKLNQLERNMNKIAQTRIRDAEKRARDAARRAEEARRRTVVAAEVGGDFIRLKPEVRKKSVDASRKVEAAITHPAEQGTVSSTGTATSAPGVSGGDLFSQGVAFYNSKQFSEAYKTFEQYLSRNPSGDKAAGTLFYMGESLYARGEYDLAILDYQKVISNHAKHKRTPTALLKQGMSFEKLTDHETAKIIYKKLISEYPDSAEATTAQQQLTRLQ